MYFCISICAIDYSIKDGDKEFFAKMHCVYDRISIESSKVRDLKAMHLKEYHSPPSLVQSSVP